MTSGGLETIVNDAPLDSLLQMASHVNSATQIPPPHMKQYTAVSIYQVLKTILLVEKWP